MVIMVTYEVLLVTPLVTNCGKLHLGSILHTINYNTVWCINWVKLFVFNDTNYT